MKKKQVLGAALGSCEKWEGIAFEGDRDLTDTNCPFCSMFTPCKLKVGACPVKVATKKHDCKGTVYYEFGMWKTADTPQRQDLAIQMYLFLLAIYFELKDNWEGYLKSIKEDRK